MATRLLQVLSFANVPASGNAMLVHQINVNGVPKRPDFTALSAQGFSVVVTTTTVTVTNNNAAPASVDVWLELKHTIPRQLGSSQITDLSPQPFNASGGGTAGVDVRDEGLAIPNNPHPIFDFVGAGVIATDMGGGVARITIPGGGGIAGINVLDDGVILPGSPYTNIDFVGPNVTATDVLGVATVSVLSGLSAGSVLFAGAGSAVSQDNANFFWDDTNNRLGIGTNTPTNLLTTLGGNVDFLDAQLYVRRNHATDGVAFLHNNNGANTGPSALGFLNQAAVFQSYVGFFPSAYAFTHLQNLNGWLAFTGADIALASATENAFRFGMTAGSTFLAMANGAAAAVSAVNTARLRYNDTAVALQSSLDGAAYFNVPQLETALTSGSVLFANASGRIAQDNAQLFWNDTTNALGVGTSTPGLFTDTKLEVHSTTSHCVASIISLAAASDAVLILGSFTPGDSAIFIDESDAIKMKFATGDVSTDAARNTNTRMTITTTGQIGIGTSTPDAAYQLHVRRTVSAQGVALIQNTSATGFSTINFVNEIGTFVLGVGHDNSSDTSYIDGASSPNPFLISHSLTANLAMNLRNLSTSGYSAIQYLDNVSAGRGSLGWANASVAITHLQSRLYWFSNASDIVFANITRNEHSFGMTGGSAFYQLAGGAAAAVSAADTGRLRYNETTDQFQTSLNAGAYFNLPQLEAALTTGSVLFANASGRIAQDNANLFYDDAANRLGIGNAAPTEALDVTGSINMTTSLLRGGTKVVGAQGAAVADAAGGATVDAEARTAINDLLARVRASTGHGLIAG
jgi:hypothetical protein